MVSVDVANFHIEKQWLSNCLLDSLHQIFRQYVHDIFVSFNLQAQLKRFS